MGFPEAVRVELLGGFRVWVGRREVGRDGWRLRKAAGVIKLLALAPGQRLHREQVLEHLWPDLDPKAAANNLRQALYVARRVLEPNAAAARQCLKLRDEQLVLGPEGHVWVDAQAFEEAVVVARRVTREPAAYRAAINLYTGDLLPEDRYEEWVVGQRETLRRSYLSLLAELAEICEERGDLDPAIEALWLAVEAEPADEEARVALIRLYARSGRRHQALLQYEQLRRTSPQQLGVDSGEPRRRLYEEMPPGPSPVKPRAAGRGGGVSAASLSRPGRHNLPAERTSFVGREDQRAKVGRILATTRLLTLTGTGGIGKTRLAMSVAADLAGSYPDGVWLAELASLRDPELVSQAVAQAVGVHEQPGYPLPITLKDHLSSKNLLLVLDNCEHLVDAVARLVETLLDFCPNLRVLTTSREALNVGGELIWRVPSLSTPVTRHPPTVENLVGLESVRLFVERARYRDPAFALTPDSARAVAEVCRKLDGIPLAIELAANRVGTLSVAQISARLEGSSKLLAGSRTAPRRQRTLEGALDWSHELLDEEEQRLFRRLSAFAGGWTVEAAEAVGVGGGVWEDGVLGLLLRLVDRSLVVVEASLEGAVRYRMLEPVRQYGRGKLEEGDEAESVHRRHAAWFLDLAEEAEIEGPRQMAWLERLEMEHDDLRAALARLRQEGEVTKGLRLCAALGRFWYLRGYFTEGRSWLEEFLGLSEGAGRTPARAKALYELGALIDRNAGPSLAEREVARSRLEESLEIYRELGDGPCAAVLRALGTVSIGVGDWAAARSALEESLELGRWSGDECGVAKTHTYLGIMTCLQGDHEPARAHFEESLGKLGERGSRIDTNTNLFFLGCLACDRGEFAAARARFEEMVEGNSLHLYRWAAPVIMLGYARLAAVEGQAARALRLAGAADALRRSVGGPAGPTFVAYHRRGLEPAWQALGRVGGAAAFGEGREMSLEEAVAYAFATEETASSSPGSPSAGSYPTALTRREREVALLVARELTNREIAGELYVSERTVTTHVHRILEKLGLHSRTQISVWAIEQRWFS